MVGGGTLQITLSSGIFGHVSQINTQRIYFTQLRHHEENTELSEILMYIYIYQTKCKENCVIWAQSLKIESKQEPVIALRKIKKTFVICYYLIDCNGIQVK